MLNKIKNLFCNFSTKKKKFFVIGISLIVVLGVGLMLRAVPANASFFGAIGDGVAQVTIYLLAAVVTLLAKLSGILLGILNQILQYNDFVNSGAVEIGWVLVRDVCNLFFIFLLLYNAFLLVLGVEKGSPTKNILQILLTAILINFSKSICGLIIDFAQVIMLTFVNAFKDSLVDNFTTHLGINNLLSLNQNTEGVDYVGVLGSVIFAFILIVIVIIILISLVIMMLYRIITLWILVLLSPFAFMMQLVPFGKKYASDWWDTFTKQVIVGPIMAFFLWLSLAILAVQGDTNSLQSKANYAGNSNDVSMKNNGNVYATISTISNSDNILGFAIATILLTTAMGMSQKFGVAGAGAMGAMGKWAKKTGTDFVKDTSKWGGRKAVQVAGKVSGNEFLKGYGQDLEFTRGEQKKGFWKKQYENIGMGENATLALSQAAWLPKSMKKAAESMGKSLKRRREIVQSAEADTKGGANAIKVLSANGGRLNDETSKILGELSKSKSGCANMIDSIDPDKINTKKTQEKVDDAMKNKGKALDKLNSKEKEVETYEKTIANYPKNKADADVAVTKAKADFKTATDNLNDAKHEFSEAENDRNNNNNEDTRKKYNEAETKRDNAQKASNEANEKLTEEKKKLATIEKDKNVADKNIGDAKKEVDNAKADFETKSKAHQEASDDHEAARRSFNDLVSLAKLLAAYEKNGKPLGSLDDVKQKLNEISNQEDLKDAGKLSPDTYKDDTSVYRSTGQGQLKETIGQTEVPASFADGKDNKLGVDFRQIENTMKAIGIKDFNLNSEGITIKDSEDIAKFAVKYSELIDQEIEKLDALKNTGNIKEQAYQIKLSKLQAGKEILADPSKLDSLELSNTGIENSLTDKKITVIHENLHTAGVQDEVITEDFAKEINQNHLRSFTSEIGSETARLEKANESISFDKVIDNLKNQFQAKIETAEGDEKIVLQTKLDKLNNLTSKNKVDRVIASDEDVPETNQPGSNGETIAVEDTSVRETLENLKEEIKTDKEKSKGAGFDNKPIVEALKDNNFAGKIAQENFSEQVNENLKSKIEEGNKRVSKKVEEKIEEIKEEPKNEEV